MIRSAGPGGRGGGLAAPPRFWHAAEQKRRDPFLDRSTKTRSQTGAELDHGRHHGRHELSDDDHRRLLREAGFEATDVVWRRGADRVLAALR